MNHAFNTIQYLFLLKQVNSVMNCVSTLGTKKIKTFIMVPSRKNRNLYKFRHTKNKLKTSKHLSIF